VGLKIGGCSDDKKLRKKKIQGTRPAVDIEERLPDRHEGRERSRMRHLRELRSCGGTRSHEPRFSGGDREKVWSYDLQITRKYGKVQNARKQTAGQIHEIRREVIRTGGDPPEQSLHGSGKSGGQR